MNTTLPDIFFIDIKCMDMANNKTIKVDSPGDYYY